MKRSRQGLTTLEQIKSAIIDALRASAPEQLKTNELSKILHIPATSDEYQLVRQSLEELVDAGTIFCGTRRRYGIPVPETIIEGRLVWMRPGQFCVRDEAGNCAVEIDSKNLWTALHGDTVRAKLLHAPRPGEIPEGEVTRVVERGSTRIVGTVKKGRGFYVDADDRKVHRTFNVRRNALGVARVGDKVLARLHEWTDPYHDPEVSIDEVIGRAGEMKAEIRSIALSFNLPFVFTDDVLAEAEAFSDQLQPEDLRDRRDLRHLDIVTIDPVDARDFDDAISLEQHDDGDVTLGVHIADVSHYVREGSALDEEAYRRGTSVYLVTGVIPMLPERLSNNLCSLRPDEDRLAYSVFARLTPRGAIRDYEVVKSVIRSRRRFSYEEALQILETGTGDYADLLCAVDRAAVTQRALRRRKGSVDFVTTELKFRLDENDMPIEVIQKSATRSTRLIEDCMLLANRIVAEHIGKHEKSSRRGGAVAPFVYRIHDVPPKDKLLELSQFVKQFGYNLPVDNIQPKDIQQLVDRARGTDHEELINEVALRSMAKAVYSEFNIGHFGLAFKHYSHFTSPIRRYPDLIVHRMLSEYAAGMSDERRHTWASTLGGITTHCSERERAAVDAERQSVKIAEVQFLKNHVGDVFSGVIGGVMPFGLFVELQRYGIEGLVAVRSMNDDFYVYDERARQLRGRSSRRSYRLGDPVFVRIVRVDEIAAHIDLELIDESEYRAEGGEEERVDVEQSAEPEVERGGEDLGERVRVARGSAAVGGGRSPRKAPAARGKRPAAKAARSGEPVPEDRKRAPKGAAAGGRNKKAVKASRRGPSSSSAGARADTSRRSGMGDAGNRGVRNAAGDEVAGGARGRGRSSRGGAKSGAKRRQR